jgi:hypothetical protein
MLALTAERTAGASPTSWPWSTPAALGPSWAGLAARPEQAAVLAGSREEVRAISDCHIRAYLALPNYRNNLLALGWSEADLEPPGSDALFDALVAWGGVEEMRQRVEEHRRAGANHVVLNLIAGDPSLPYLEGARLRPASGRGSFRAGGHAPLRVSGHE